MRPRPNTNSGSSGRFSNLLLLLNAVVMTVLIARLGTEGTTKTSDLTGSLLRESESVSQPDIKADPAKTEPPVAIQEPASTISISTNNRQMQSSTARDFLAIAKKTGTDKVEGHANLQKCVEHGDTCLKPKFVREKCRPWGHFYDTLYQRWLEPFSRDDAAKFQFLEIGFYSGKGFAAYQEFLPQAEAHSIEIACVDDGKNWDLGNTAKEWNLNLYTQLMADNRLHCGSATDLAFLDQTWSQMKARNLPLRVVVDDASHQSAHMIQSVFYWFPKIEPGGFLIVEDIQPIPSANAFRTQFLPQLMSDLHYCGHPDYPEEPFFPTLYPLLASVSCEMHICVLERNQEPANLELSTEQLKPPRYALDYDLALKTCKTESSLK